MIAQFESSTVRGDEDLHFSQQQAHVLEPGNHSSSRLRGNLRGGEDLKLELVNLLTVHNQTQGHGPRLSLFRGHDKCPVAGPGANRKNRVGALELEHGHRGCIEQGGMDQSYSGSQGSLHRPEKLRRGLTLGRRRSDQLGIKGGETAVQIHVRTTEGTRGKKGETRQVQFCQLGIGSFHGSIAINVSDQVLVFRLDNEEENA